MKILCVAGTSSGVGKTAVACALLKHVPGWAALKVTRCHPGRGCPRGKACSVCSGREDEDEMVDKCGGMIAPLLAGCTQGGPTAAGPAP